jgi:uncharacterized protein (UPF0332 family)/predicted nucleotidyltransferase
MSADLSPTIYAPAEVSVDLSVTSLTAGERQAVGEFLAELGQLLGDVLLGVTLFGSAARGENRIESDVDLLVLVDHDLSLRELGAINRSASRLGIDCDAVLSLLIMGPENRRFHERNRTLLWRNIAEDGIVLLAPAVQLREAPADYRSPYEVIRLYMEHSNRCLASAQVLIDSDFQLRAISECYYAVFYATSAMLYSKGIERAKHSGIRSALSQYLIKTGELPDTLGIVFTDLQRDRESADYDMRYLPGPETADNHMKQAQEFVEIAKDYLRQQGFFNE